VLILYETEYCGCGCVCNCNIVTLVLCFVECNLPHLSIHVLYLAGSLLLIDNIL